MNKVPPREPLLSGGHFVLPAIAVSVKPLANIVANYTCCNRHEEFVQTAHETITPFPWTGRGRLALLL